MTTREPDFKPDFKLNRPGALIGALPAILGFVPEKSLVVVSVDGGELGSVMRVDLSDQLVDTVGQLAEVVEAANPSAAIAVIVDAEGARCPVCNDQYRQLCATLAGELAAHGTELWAAHVVDRVAAGGRWHCVDGCGSAGPVDDPSASPLAAAAVLDGRRLYSRRVDLHAVIAADESPRAVAVAEAIGGHALARDRSCADDLDGRARRDVADVIAAIAGVADDRWPTDDELATLGCTLTDVRVRDVLFGLSIADNSADAETFWALLSRTLPEPWRVEALVLLAFSAYARGDGPLAGVALEAALAGASTHRMAGMLDTSLQSGLRPERIRELAETGYRLARRIGASMPPRRDVEQRAG